MSKEEVIETTGDGGTLKATGEDIIEVTMFEGHDLAIDELTRLYPDFEIVEQKGRYAKLIRKKAQE